MSVRAKASTGPAKRKECTKGYATGKKRGHKRDGAQKRGWGKHTTHPETPKH